MRFSEILTEFSTINAGQSADLGSREALFWEEVTRSGTPLVDACEDDPGQCDVTFLYRAVDPTIRSVRLSANRVTDKHRQDAGVMTPVPGTGIWGVTLRLPADLRCSYGFSPSASETPEPLGSPQRPGPAVLVDPLNLDPPLTRPDQPGPGEGSSVFSGPLAPDHGTWLFDAEPALIDTDRDAVAGSRLGEDCDSRLFVAGDREIGDVSCPVRVSLPSGAAPAGVLVLFDGLQWFDHLGVDRAVAAAGLPDLIIIGIGTRTVEQRSHTLAGNDAFLRSVADELVPAIEAEAAAHGCPVPEEARRIICGQSLGGLSALLMAQVSPGTFDAVLAHSPSLWWRPGGSATPADLAEMTGDDWTAARFLASGSGANVHAARAAERAGPAAGAGVGARTDGSGAGARTPGAGVGAEQVHLAVGDREGPMVDRARRMAEVLHDLGCRTSLSVYSGGHDFACWRVELIAGLRRVFEPSPSRPADGETRVGSNTQE